MMNEQRQKIIEEYWLKRLAAPIEPLRLPVFEYVATERTPGSGLLRQDLPAAVATRLKRISKDSDTALFILFVSALAVVLERYTGVADIAILTLAPQGPVPQPLVLRTQITRDLSFGAVLDQLRATVMEAFNHAEYDFAALLGKLQARSAQDLRAALTVAALSDALQRWPDDLARPELLLTLEVADDSLSLRAEYDPQQYEAAIVAYLLENVLHLLTIFPPQLKRPLAELELVSPAEKQVLLAFNQTRSDYPREATVVELFEEQVARQPNAPVLLDGDTVLSYQELNERANRLAHSLRARGVGPDERVVLLLEPTLEAIIGIVAIVKAGGCYVPINPSYPLARQRLLLDDIAAKVVLTTTAQAEQLHAFVPDAAMMCVDDATLLADDTTNPVRCNRPQDILYVLYTSGTTGMPKGVMVEQRSAVRLVKQTDYIQFAPDDRILRSSALEFDVSTFEIWGALLNGLALGISRREQLLDPAQLKALIAHYRITTLWLTSPLFAQHAQTDITLFQGLRYLFTGGDVVSPYFAGLVKQHYPELKIINAYGPTENTTYSSTFAIEGSYRVRTPVGRPVANSTGYIVDSYGNLQAIGVPGELYVGGDGVARGYFKRPALTAERFLPNPFVTFEGVEQGIRSSLRLYKTGDLARWRPDGTIEFLERIDDQVKIRGYRIEPGEILDRLLHHPAVQDAVVMAIANDTADKVLCAYLVSSSQDTRAFKEYLAQTLPDYMVPTYFVYLDQLPLNANGKIDRQRLPRPTVDVDAVSDAPRDELEQQMAALWQEVLDIPSVGIYDDFFDIGGHSMKAIKLISLIHKTFGVKLGLQHVLRSLTIADLADTIRQIDVSPYITIERQPAQPYYELSVSQRRLAEIYAQDAQNTAFNISLHYTWPAPVDADILRQALATLIERHDSLRAYLTKVDGRFVQVIGPVGEPNLVVIDLSGLSAAERQAQRAALIAAEESLPFVLETAPLYRMKLLRGQDDACDLLWTMHHIVADGWSMDVLETELRHLYECYQAGRESDLEPVRLQFKDYIIWHNQLLADPRRVELARSFWRETLHPPLPVLALPYDFAKTSSTIGQRSAGYHATLSDELTQDLRGLAKEHGSSLFLVLFAGFNLLLAELSGQNDIITGIPSANRYHEDLQNTVGFLVDSVIIRTPVLPNEDLAAFLQRVSANTLKTLDHAYYPIELACETVETTWPEILLTFFNMSTFGDVNQRILHDSNWYHIDQVQSAKLELSLYLTEYRNGVEINAHYYCDLFAPATIAGAMQRYRDILAHMARGEYPSLDAGQRAATVISSAPGADGNDLE